MGKSGLSNYSRMRVADGARLKCRHCNERNVNRPRGLCWACYYRPGVIALYPSKSKYARRGHDNSEGGPEKPPGPPTRVAPGTWERLLVMARRASERRPTTSPGDADGQGVGVRLRRLRRALTRAHLDYFFNVVLGWAEPDGSRRSSVGEKNQRRYFGRIKGGKTDGDVAQGVA